MNAPSQTAVIHKSSEANLSLSATLFVWVCAFDREKMLKVERKKKRKKKKKKRKERKRKKHTNSIATIRARASPPSVSLSGWNFTTQPREQNISYDFEYNVTIRLFFRTL